MRALSNFLHRISTPLTILLSTLVFIIFSATVLPAQSAAAAQYSGNSGSPDLSFFYTPNRLYLMAEEFGSTGRDAYLYARFTFDLAFPFVYGLFLSIWIGWLTKKLSQKPD